MKYFGILKNTGFEQMETDQQHQLLLEVGAYVQTHVVRLTNELQQVWPPTTPPLAKPGKEFIEEFYSFLREFFVKEIERNFLIKMQKFNEDTYGLNKKQRRKKALQRFKLLFEESRNHSVNIVFSGKYNGLETVKNLGKLETLRWQQQALQGMLAECWLNVGFINGDSNFYNDSTAANDPLIQEFVLLESILKCLLLLNQEFEFETDSAYHSSYAKKQSRKKIKTASNKKTALPTAQATSKSKPLDTNSSIVFTKEAAFEYLLEKVF